MKASQADKSRQKPTWKPLSLAQENCIDRLILGDTDQEAATAVGVSRQTVWEWRARHPVFMATLQERRAELYRGVTERLRSGLGKAVDTLLGAVHQGDLRAALELLKCCGIYGDGTMHQIRDTDPTAIAERLCQEAMAREGISANGSLDRLLTLQANPRYEQRKAELMAELMGGDGGPEARR
jgi:hypothetical protein